MSNYISSLQAKVLLTLLEQNEPQTASTLAQRLGAKASTIRYHLLYVQQIVKKYGGELIARPKIGYILKITPEQAAELRAKLNSPDFQFHYDDADRQKIILFELLASPTALTISSLAESLGTSKTTLIQDMDEVENWLKKYHITLNRQARKGTHLSGEEVDIRRALVYLLQDTLHENDLLNICRWGMVRQTATGAAQEQAQNYFFAHINSWDLRGAWWVINRMLDKLSYRPSDQRYLFLVLYWAVMLQRIQQNFSLKLSDTIISAMQESAEYRAVVTAADELTRSYGISIPVTELAHFSAEIQTSARSAYNQLAEMTEESPDQKAVQIAEYLVEQIKKRMEFHMTDPVIFRRLVKHIGRTLARMKFNLSSDNAFTGEVIKNYPNMWNTLSDAIQHGCEETRQFGQEEIAYLSMYFILAQELERKATPRRSRRVIVACPAGGISIWMLVSRLQKEFPDVEIVAAISLRDLAQQDKSQADLIITTAHHVVDAQLPVITVSPFLNEQEILQLKARLD